MKLKFRRTVAIMTCSLYFCLLFLGLNIVFFSKLTQGENLEHGLRASILRNSYDSSLLESLNFGGNETVASSPGEIDYVPGFGRPDTYQEGGYWNIDEHTGSKMYYYFVSCSRGTGSEIPTIMFLQGGPGASSLWSAIVGLNGPFKLEKDNRTLSRNQFSWTSFAHMLFVDNPVGVGYSFTSSGYVKNDEEIGRDLYKGLQQFYKDRERKFKIGSKLYIFGQSYGGKYVPAIASRILEENEKLYSNSYFQTISSIHIDLRGIAIGNGWTDPVSIASSWSKRFHEIGLFDHRQMKYFDKLAANVTEAIRKKDYRKAADLGYAYESMITESVGGINRYDFRTFHGDDFSNVDRYFERPETMRAFNGEHKYGSTREKVFDSLYGDIYKSIAFKLPFILERVPILSHTGMYDLGCNFIATENLYLKRISWSQQKKYAFTERRVWRAKEKPNEILGWYKKGGNLTLLVSFRGGHMWLAQDPASAFQMAHEFVAGHL